LCTSAYIFYCLVSDISFICSKFLYPKRDFANDAMSDDGDNLQAGNHDGKYELFAEVDNTVREEIKDLVFNGEKALMWETHCITSTITTVIAVAGYTRLD